MTRVLMVCLGNICRSPMAEGVLRYHAEQAGITIEIDSAGTGSYHIGEAPDSRAIKCMKAKGIDISSLRARQFTKNDFDDFDVIYAMDASNYENILKLAHTDRHREKVMMILNEIYPGENRPVPDPYFGKMDGFEEVFDLLENACDLVIKRLR